MQVNWQVCSLIVQTRSDQVSRIQEKLKDIPNCEVAISDELSGQLIVVLEADDNESLIQNIELIRNFNNVLSVSLVYHQQE